MSDIKIIDNYLSENDHQKILKFVGGTEMVWYYGNVLPEVYKSECDSYTLSKENASKYNYQNYHVIFEKVFVSKFYNETVADVLVKLNPDALVRVKLNMTHCSEKIIEHGFHCDNDFKNCKTAIYYLNSNDGYTIFENGEKVNSIANRMVMFPSHMKHSGTTCTNTNCRLVLNINYFKD